MQSQEKIDALRQWMQEKGCILHPHISIPASFDGVLGIGSTGLLPHKTLILAVPSNLILTVTRCYNDPKLKKLFENNDDLFDYEASQDSEFNVLCVFMMYHKIHSQDSPWKEYFEAISQPETAIDWTNFQLKGLNRSIIEEVIHVRRECQKLQEDLIAYLMKRKQFSGLQEDFLRKIFHFCYRAVMNRSFGYYFSQTCLIPVADLVNHGCQAVDHQLINVNFEKGTQFQEGYFNRKDKINCELLGLETVQPKNLPFRHRFLVENNIVDPSEQNLANLDRRSINSQLYAWNAKRFKEGEKLQALHFCSEDQEEDNDTDQEFEAQKERQLQVCKQNQQEQMKLFQKHFVKIQKYKDVEEQLQDIKDGLGVKRQLKKPENKEQPMQEKPDEMKEQATTECLGGQKNIQKSTSEGIVSEEKREPEKSNEKISEVNKNDLKRQNPFSLQAQASGVPIKIFDQSSDQEDEEDDQEWGMKQGSYFTMSTSSPIAGNKQIFNSYGSRTNRFLLVWYGFTYPDNLYDSVAFRLHVQFGPLRPAKEIVLDTYVGGQGLSFRKNQNQMVKDTEVSRQFRLKRNRLPEKLIIFLRLFLMNYYKGQDLYKLFVTFPSSIDFQLFVFNYIKDIVLSLYDRYPQALIQQLQTEQKMQQHTKISHKIRFKIIYLTQQRKLLDINVKAVQEVIKVLKRCQEKGGVMERALYEDVPIEVLRVIRTYLMQYEKQQEYINHKQGQPTAETQVSAQPVEQMKLKKKKQQKETIKEKVEAREEDQEWEDVSDEENAQS